MKLQGEFIVEANEYDRSDGNQLGVERLRKELVERDINVELCAEEVRALVQDYITFRTVGAKVQMAVVKIQTWWRKLLRTRLEDSQLQSLSHSETISLEEESENEWESLYNHT